MDDRQRAIFRLFLCDIGMGGFVQGPLLDWLLREGLEEEAGLVRQCRDARDVLLRFPEQEMLVGRIDAVQRVKVDAEVWPRERALLRVRFAAPFFLGNVIAHLRDHGPARVGPWKAEVFVRPESDRPLLFAAELSAGKVLHVSPAAAEPAPPGDYLLTARTDADRPLRLAAKLTVLT